MITNGKPPVTRIVGFEVSVKLLKEVDKEAARLTREDPFGRQRSRSEAIRQLLCDGLKFRTDRRARAR